MIDLKLKMTAGPNWRKPQEESQKRRTEVFHRMISV